MSGNSRCNIYIGNLDERVSERVLYDILIQAGRVVDLYIPRDKETDKPKGYAFAEYESQEIADYAIKLFNGLVTLYNRTLRFAFSGQDKNSQNSSATVTPSSRKSRTDPIPLRVSNMEISPQSTRISAPFRISTNPASIFSPEEPPPPGVTVTHQSNEDGTHISGGNYECSRRVFGSTLDSINHSRSRRYDSSMTSGTVALSTCNWKTGKYCQRLEEFLVAASCSCIASLIHGCAFQVLPAPVQNEV